MTAARERLVAELREHALVIGEVTLTSGRTAQYYVDAKRAILWIEGPELDPGERCLVVEDVVTSGGSTVRALERVREEGLEIAGVVSVLDRLAGGAEAIRAAAGGAPYAALTTIDDVYPERPDRTS